MSFSFNHADMQQQSFFDSFNFLTKREQRFLDKSWAKTFAEFVFPAIDEAPFAVLYSNVDSRPNTPVNVIVGSLIIEALTNQSDEELLESLLFDVRYQYALHTTHFEEQPMSDRTLGRFRARCNAYELETGIDLIHDTVVSLADEMAKFMKINRQLKRMDSLMVASNLKKMSRLELLYTCTANLVKEMDKQGIEIPADQKHYLSSSDYNQVIYHNRGEGSAARIDSVLSDVQALLPLCEGQLDGSSAYLLMLRVLSEQTEKDQEGRCRLKGAGSGMTADILQNPADPEATFREKAGKQYRGYVANVIEETGELGSIVTDYQYEQNTYSDSQFTRDMIERLGEQEEAVTVVADGAFSGQTNEELAAECNIELVFTNLTGKEARDIHADFEFNEEGTKVTRCAGGYSPRSCCYNEKNGQCVASFERSQCENCPHKEECRPKVNKRTCRKTITHSSKKRAQQQRYRKSEEFSKYSAFRNGVESIPSILRRKYNIDHMPVRGKLRGGLFFGCKIAALNFNKLCRYLQGLGECAQTAEIA